MNTTSTRAIKDPMAPAAGNSFPVLVGAWLVLASAGCTSTTPAGGSGGTPGGSGSGGTASTGGVTGSGGAPVGSGGAAPGTGGVGSGGTNTGGASSGGRGGGVTGGRGSASGGAGGTGGAGATGGTTGAAGSGGPSLCTPGKYLLCEDFEATAVGAIPTGWTKHGAAAVASDQAARGLHSLKVSPQESGERRIYGDASKLGSGHWGRIFYKVQLPAPVSCDTNPVLHSTFIGLQGIGPTRGAEEVRVVDTVEDKQGMHQWLYNVQPSGAEFGKESPYSWKYDGMWHCAEWHIDNPTQSFHFYLDGSEVTQIAITNGAGNYNGSEIPPSFSQIRAGLYNYQKACSPYLTVWIDEIALDTNRVGCGN